MKEDLRALVESMRLELKNIYRWVKYRLGL